MGLSVESLATASQYLMKTTRYGFVDEVKKLLAEHEMKADKSPTSSRAKLWGWQDKWLALVFVSRSFTGRLIFSTLSVRSAHSRVPQRGGNFDDQGLQEFSVAW